MRRVVLLYESNVAEAQDAKTKNKQTNKNKTQTEHNQTNKKQTTYVLQFSILVYYVMLKLIKLCRLSVSGKTISLSNIIAIILTQLHFSINSYTNSSHLYNGFSNYQETHH